MAAAQAQTKADHDALIEASRAQLEADLDAACDRYQNDYIQPKEDAFNAYVAAQTAAWNNTVADKTAIVMGAINDAEDFIANASAQKRADLAKRAKEIKWAISSIFEYRWKEKLSDKLDAAVAAMNAICDAREAMFAERVQDARDAWNASVDAETDALNDATAAKDQACDDAQAAQTAAFDQYKVDAWTRFKAWAAAAAEDMDNHIADCEEAWTWILHSYCLIDVDDHQDDFDADDDGDHDYFDHYGQGCGHGHYYGITAKDKNVDIASHDAVLAYG
jgi:hypothetical protein